METSLAPSPIAAHTGCSLNSETQDISFYRPTNRQTHRRPDPLIEMLGRNKIFYNQTIDAGDFCIVSLVLKLFKPIVSGSNQNTSLFRQDHKSNGFDLFPTSWHAAKKVSPFTMETICAFCSGDILQQSTVAHWCEIFEKALFLSAIIKVSVFPSTTKE